MSLQGSATDPNPEAAAEYLSYYRDTARGVNGVFQAVALLMIGLLLTILSQRLELKTYQRQKGEIDSLLGLPWMNVRIFYQELPDDYLTTIAQPWYSLCLITVAVDIGLASKFTTLTYKLSQAVLMISTTEGYLSTYSADLRSITADRKMSVRFDDLPPDQLQALLRVMTFRMQPTEKEFREGLLQAQASVDLFRRLEEGVHKQDPKRTIFETSAFRDKILATSSSLPKFDTLAAMLYFEDYRTFNFLSGNESELLQKQLMPALTSGRIPTLGALQAKQAALQTAIYDLQNNSTVHVPFVDLAMPLSTFGIFATLMNIALLCSLAILQNRIHRSINLARRFLASPNHQLESAILSGVFFGSFSHWPAAILRSVTIALPSLLGIYLVGATYRTGFAVLSASTAALVILATAIWMFNKFDCVRDDQVV
jgi:hypothetical protein